MKEAALEAGVLVGKNEDLVADSFAPIGSSKTAAPLARHASTQSASGEFLQSFPEGGYGWLVVLSTFLINFVVFGYVYSWGVYQSLYLTDIYKGRITTFQLTFVGGLTMALLFALGPFFSMLNRLFGFKLLMCLGAVIQPLGILLASWTNSPWQLYFTHGALIGIGSSLIFFPSVFLPTQWFMKRRGLATGIAVSGSGIGGLAYGPVTRELIDAVGFRWCLRYVAIGSFVILVVAVLLARECEATKKPLDAMSMHSQKDAKKEKLIDISVLKRKDFAALAMMATLATFGYMAPFYFLPSYASFIGLTESDGALFVGLSSGVNAVGRIVLGYIADMFGRVNALFSCVFFSGLTVLLIWTFSTSYGVLLLFVLLYGFSAGGFISLFPVVTAELVGLDELPNAIGLLYASNAVGNLFGPAIAGALLDSTQPDISYLPVQLFCGFITIAGSFFILWLRTMRTHKLFARV
ncbi:major facilitator superfamily domain-containing protein [Thamnocephalis sphaerospora]|uniref:Major facilitator superfamily domain-containing protein n=1 Tax=Thamnocephalis sphaerospora TaxID=78915 RepID=A0A4P9XVH5_9FUNG|nr:major facilitator superfamily domain-containing protein [Thamnocephalis sphaerospora]|eukprot:RKP09410.1 major facilitator superfamily domain-containing protein [Thamnocephalis sphaerospora]